MKKFILIAFKIIPLLTIIQGVLSGGARMGPFVDTLKVAMTQYEVAQILKIVSTSPQVITKPDKFPDFLQENFHNQYSVLVREIKGDKSRDLSRDIWGKPFHLLVLINDGQVKMGSNGPDGAIGTKDDVAATITVDLSPLKKPARTEKKPGAPVEVEEATHPEMAHDQMDENREPAEADEYAQDQHNPDQQHDERADGQEYQNGHEENVDQRPHDTYSEEGAPQSEHQDI